MGVLVSINHETGNLSQYDTVSGAGIVASTLAGLNGTTWGMRATLNNTDTNYAEKSFTWATTHIFAEFYANYANITYPNGQDFRHFTFRRGGAVLDSLLSIGVMGGLYVVQGSVLDDASVLRSTEWAAFDRTGPVKFAFHVFKAQTAVSNDGGCIVSVNDAPLVRRLNVDLFDRLPSDRFRFGVQNADSGCSGPLDMDELVITEDSAVPDDLGLYTFRTRPRMVLDGWHRSYNNQQ